MNGIMERVGKIRTDIPWAENILDPELVELVRNYQKEDRPILLALLRKYPDKKLHIFKTRKEADEWLLFR